MAALKVKKLWTVFITAFFAVLASLGLTTPAGATGSVVRRPAEQPAGGSAAAPVVRPRAAETAHVRAALPRQVQRDRSLPPTIKQRIRAEAHGSSPSVRRMPVDTSAGGATDSGDAGNIADIRPAATTSAGTAAGSGTGADRGARTDRGVRTDRGARTAIGASRAADAALTAA
ncbi:DUF6344 domain-containing protein [Streptomyces sp. 150FB]|uniref:DUF6344 domain-containing protein n=1 Tax=Streptomyces sp. 150FB TaxID=1576605 RepID=UPI0007C73283|nr:DUF6344 domain-containing protein [Streptomyces sp. 150FB]